MTVQQWQGVIRENSPSNGVEMGKRKTQLLRQINNKKCIKISQSHYEN